MLNIPVLRWGQPYESLDTDEVKHFLTGETIAKVGQANGGLLQRDMRHAPRARQVLRDIAPSELTQRIKKAADLYLNATLPMGDGVQSPDDFARQQSASTHTQRAFRRASCSGARISLHASPLRAAAAGSSSAGAK